MAPLEQDRAGQKSRNPPNEPECGCWSFGKFKQNLGLGVVAQFLIAHALSWQFQETLGSAQSLGGAFEDY